MKKIIVGAMAVGIAVISIGCSSENVGKINPKIKSGEEVKMFIASDTHYLAESIRDNGKAFIDYYQNGDGKQLNYSSEIMDTFVGEIQDEKPNLLIISGDITNNGEYESHIELAEKLRKIEDSGTEVYVIPGNHDIENPYARGFEADKQIKIKSISRKDFTNIYNDFGYSEAIMKDKNSSSYLAAPSEDLWLLMLDTSITKNNKRFGYPQTDGQLTEKSIDWIRKCFELANKTGAKVVPVMHHNGLNHNEVISNGFTIKDNLNLLKVFQEYGANLMFSGHIHIQDIAAESINDEKIYDIASNALSVFPNQYGVLKYNNDSGYSYNTKNLDVESWAKRNGSTNEELLNFEEYSKEFFGEVGTRRPYMELVDSGYSEEDCKNAIEVLRKLNQNYFAGIENAFTEDIRNTKGYEILQQHEEFLKGYTFVISQDLNVGDNNKIVIPNN